MQSSVLFAAVIIAAAGASCGVEASAADVVPTAAPTATAASAPKPCTDSWSFIATDCQLTWRGITVYGAIDGGAAGRATARRGIHGPLLEPHT